MPFNPSIIAYLTEPLISFPCILSLQYMENSAEEATVNYNNLRDSVVTRVGGGIGNGGSIASNLVNYMYLEDAGKQYIYNVVYTGEKPPPSLPMSELNK